MRSNEFNQSMFLSESAVLKTGTSIYAYNIYFDREVAPILQEWVDFYYKPIPLREGILSDQEVEKFFQTVGQYQVAKKLGSDLATFEPFQKDDVKELKSKAIDLNKKVAKMLTNALTKARKAATDFKDMTPESREKAIEGIKKDFGEKFQKLQKHSSKEGVGDLLKKVEGVWKNMFPEGWAKDPEWWREFGAKVLPILAIMTVSVTVGMIGGPWAARFVSITLKNGLKFLEDGEIDAKSIAISVGMAVAAGEITKLIGGAAEEAQSVANDATGAPTTVGVDKETVQDAINSVADTNDEAISTFYKDVWNGKSVYLADEMKNLAELDLANGQYLRPEDLFDRAFEEIYGSQDVSGHSARTKFSLMKKIFFAKLANGELETGGNFKGSVSMINQDWAEALQVDKEAIEAMAGESRDAVIETGIDQAYAESLGKADIQWIQQTLDTDNAELLKGHLDVLKPEYVAYARGQHISFEDLNRILEQNNLEYSDKNVVKVLNAIVDDKWNNSDMSGFLDPPRKLEVVQ